MARSSSNVGWIVAASWLCLGCGGGTGADERTTGALTLGSADGGTSVGDDGGDGNADSSGDGGTGQGCAAPLEDCGGSCVNTQSDPQNCGACDAACDPSQVCGNGACLDMCPANLVDCGGMCIDPAVDPTFCGASGDCQGPNVGQACTVGETCESGTCTLVCPPGLENCDGTCVDTAADPLHCGMCGMQCVPPGGGTAVCVSPGTCSFVCDPGLTSCNNATCEDLVGDANNCGSCGFVCGGGEACVLSNCLQAVVDINFDEMAEPCVFNQTSPLTTRYAGLGVTFAGPSATQGGAILDQCGGFSASGHSSPNFVAFNSGTYAAPPETMTFAGPVQTVTFNAGAGTGPLTVEALDQGGAVIQTITPSITPAVTPITLTGPLWGVRVVSGPVVFVIDDLHYEF